MQNGPPGLQEADVASLIPQLPNRRGMLQIAGYYQHGAQYVVVYDVLDDQGQRVTSIRAPFPGGLPFLAPGTRYPLK